MNRGVQFEWSLVYHSLKQCKYTDGKLLARHRNLHSYTNNLDSLSLKTLKNIPKDLLSTAYHSDELEIYGNPEPKTDILFGENHEYKVSVKMPGAIQLSSAEGKTTAQMFNLVLNEYGRKTEDIVDVIDKIEKMPTKMLTQRNMGKARARVYNKYIQLVTEDGNINPKYNWDIYRDNNKLYILETLRKYIERNPDFMHIFVHEALTGYRLFHNSNATANWILTPNYFVEITDKYIENILPKLKMDLRAKSRDGITSATFRVDYNDVRGTQKNTAKL